MLSRRCQGRAAAAAASRRPAASRSTRLPRSQICGAGAGEHSRHAGSGNAQLGKDRSCTYRPSFSSASARRWRTCDDAGRRVAHSIKVDLRTRCRAGRQDMSAA